ncbi:unnamed protein product, partial [Meganyctiphanes norvegica]
QGGWGDLICLSENNPKHHKTSHRNHHSHHADSAHWEHNKLHGRSGDKYKGHPRLARDVDVTQFFAFNKRKQRGIQEPQNQTETIHFSVGDTQRQQMGNATTPMKVGALASVDSLDSIADIMRGLNFGSMNKKDKKPWETKSNYKKDDKDKNTQQSTMESGPIKVSDESVIYQTAAPVGEAIEVKQVTVNILEDTSLSSYTVTEETISKTEKEQEQNIKNMAIGPYDDAQYKSELDKIVGSVTEPIPEPEPTKYSEDKPSNSNNADQNSSITRESHSLMFPSESTENPLKDPSIIVPTEVAVKFTEGNSKDHPHIIHYSSTTEIPPVYNTYQSKIDKGNNMIQEPTKIINVQHNTNNDERKFNSSSNRDDSGKPDNISKNSDLNTRIVNTDVDNEEQDLPDILFNVDGQIYKSLKHEDSKTHSNDSNPIKNGSINNDNNKSNTIDNDTNIVDEKTIINSEKVDNIKDAQNDISIPSNPVFVQNENADTTSNESMANDSQNNNDRTGRSRNIEDKSLLNSLLEKEIQTDGLEDSEIKSRLQSITQENSETELKENSIDVFTNVTINAETNKEIVFPNEHKPVDEEKVEKDEEKNDMHGSGLDKNTSMFITHSPLEEIQKPVNREDHSSQLSSTTSSETVVMDNSKVQIETINAEDTIEEKHTSTDDGMGMISESDKHDSTSETTNENDDDETTDTEDTIEELHTNADDGMGMNSESDKHDSTSETINENDDDETTDTEDTIEELHTHVDDGMGMTSGSADKHDSTSEITNNNDAVNDGHDDDHHHHHDDDNDDHDDHDESEASDQMNKVSIPTVDDMKTMEEDTKLMEEVSSPIKEDINPTEEDSKPGDDAKKDEVSKSNDKSSDQMSEVSNPIPLKEEPKPIEDKTGLKPVNEEQDLPDILFNLDGQINSNDKESITEETSRKPRFESAIPSASDSSTNDESSSIPKAGSAPIENKEENPDHSALLQYILASIFG